MASLQEWCIQSRTARHGRVGAAFVSSAIENPACCVPSQAAHAPLTGLRAPAKAVHDSCDTLHTPWCKVYCALQISE